MIQTFGRAARNIDGNVIMYADHITDSIKIAILETERRRNKQIQYNKDNGIVPKSMVKAISNEKCYSWSDIDVSAGIKSMAKSDLLKLALETEAHMKKFAEELDFEKAIEFREYLTKIKKALGEPILSRGFINLCMMKLLLVVQVNII